MPEVLSPRTRWPPSSESEQQMKDVKYIGDRGPVEIEIGPQQWVTVDPGGVIAVRDEVAESLAEQHDMWELPATKKKGPA